jgi:hypothetical protein
MVEQDMTEEGRHSTVPLPALPALARKDPSAPDHDADTDTGSPGSHLRNWQPGGDDTEELMLQIADALRNGESERHLAKLLDVPRSMLWRGKKLAAIPEGLCKRLLEARPRIGSKALTWIGRYCETGDFPPIEMECCPNCGHILRSRSEKGIRRTLDIINKWIEDGRPEATADGTGRRA